jgi:transposase
MEACGGSHYWAREIGELGHDVRLIAPAYVKPFVKRQKNDAADAEAICEAAQRPNMRFVPVKSEATQGAAAVFGARERLVRQRTQAISALRGHPGEFGMIAAQGAADVSKLIACLEGETVELPAAGRAALKVLVVALRHLEEQIGLLDAEIARRAREDDLTRRLMTSPGVGPRIATAFATLAPDAATFRRGRDFAAWLGLTPRQHSSGGWDRRRRWRTLVTSAPDHRGERRRHLAPTQGRDARHMAGRDAGAQTGDAGAGGVGQQDGADRLGSDGQRRDLQGSGWAA